MGECKLKWPGNNQFDKLELHLSWRILRGPSREEAAVAVLETASAWNANRTQAAEISGSIFNGWLVVFMEKKRMWFQF